MNRYKSEMARRSLCTLLFLLERGVTSEMSGMIYYGIIIFDVVTIRSNIACKVVVKLKQKTALTDLRFPKTEDVNNCANTIIK